MFTISEIYGNDTSNRIRMSFADVIPDKKGVTMLDRSAIRILAERQGDRVWKVFTELEFVAQWWGRGNKLIIERMDVERGGHWRYVEHAPDGVHGFEGRYREVTPPERLVSTFEWDGMPGYVVVNSTTFEDLGDGRTKVVTTSLFHTTEERDGMLESGMEEGLNQSYHALDRLLSQ